MAFCARGRRQQAGRSRGSDEEAEVRGREQKGRFGPGFCRFAPCGGRRAFGRSPVRGGGDMPFCMSGQRRRTFPIDGAHKFVYNESYTGAIGVFEGRTIRGDSGALYPQSATAGENSRLRVPVVWTARPAGVMRDRSCAMFLREPCQAGNRAALSGFEHVPRECLF